MKRNYIVQIAGNEITLDAYVTAVFERTCKPSSTYPFPYTLPGLENCLNSTIIEYFLEQPFSYNRSVDFLDNLINIDKEGYKGVCYSFDKWIERIIKEPYFTTTGDKYSGRLVLRSNAGSAAADTDIIRFMCYLAVCHLKYGPSYASVTATEYFEMATALGSDEPARLKEFGSGSISRELTNYQDSTVSCEAIDALALIKLTIHEEAEPSYMQALEFINRLLRVDFPPNYAIEFSSPQQHWLPIDGLPRTGAHALAANVVAYPNLHPLLQAYANQAMRPNTWYTDLPDKDCAKPATFAVFALGLQSEAYFELVKSYMLGVDEEHQSVQENFTPVFLMKYGVTRQSLPVIISCLLSTQWHAHFPALTEQFRDAASLNLLLEFRADFPAYLDEQQEEDPEELADYLWEMVINALFGAEADRSALLAQTDETLRPLYEAIFLLEE